MKNLEIDLLLFASSFGRESKWVKSFLEEVDRGPLIKLFASASWAYPQGVVKTLQR